MIKIPETKTEAIALFGSKAEFCRAVGCTLQSLAFWNETLTRKARDRVELALIKRQIGFD